MRYQNIDVPIYIKSYDISIFNLVLTEPEPQTPIEEPITEVPTTEIPTTEEPTTEEPTTEEPTTEEPTTEVPTTEEPTTEIPTIEIPLTESPVWNNSNSDLKVTNDLSVSISPVNDIFNNNFTSVA
ncbi:hypothetical protein [Macrococcus brunensis]|uniref:hypothetical protein n=1 Tax=Macrococcus brunensis TaxID=198483 RepID=UPI001EEFDF4E|nr:hypothetical protein [Macrococcus brunensis]ULG71819.1 hypothetical protein MGG12_11080 [Macrococcus brunensis]